MLLVLVSPNPVAESVFKRRGGVEVSVVVVVVAEVVVVVVAEVAMVVIVDSCGLSLSNCELECQCSGVRA